MSTIMSEAMTHVRVAIDTERLLNNVHEDGRGDMLAVHLQ